MDFRVEYREIFEILGIFGEIGNITLGGIKVNILKWRGRLDAGGINFVRI